jgi:hypothetical protein
MSRPRCAGTFGNGKACFHPAAEGRPYCLLHDPERVEELRAEMARRGRNGREKAAAAMEAYRSARRETCSLRTTDDLLSELERALLAVESSKGDVIERETARIKIIAEARATLKAAEFETENRELKRLLIELKPELRGKLKAVP